MIVVVDYGAGNLRSVAKALAALGHPVQVTDAPAAVAAARALVLPGVGAAADTMRNLRARGLDTAVRDYLASGRPFLGVCMGLQALFTGSEEGGWQPCLDIVPGRVRRLPPGQKVPHMGWNQVRQARPHPLFAGIPDGAYFYFVHSFYVEPADPAVIIGHTEYGIEFASAIAQGHVLGTQFHPEKSGAVGLRLYANFVRLALGELPLPAAAPAG